MIELYYIEDDPDIARTVKEYLERKDFRVTVCTTVAQARQALHTRVPALILLDQNMPDGRGDSLCRWIRSNWKELPIIFLTVRGDCEDIVSGFHDGADDYVVKPFELEVLYSRIQALLRRAGNASKRYFSCDGIVMDVERRWDANGNFVNDNTLTVTMKRLRDKLGQPACLKTVRSVGYRMEDTI